VLALEIVVLLALSLAGAGPGTAAAYHVTNRLANGELFEPSRFWGGFRRYFWRGWLLALADVGAGGLLALNIWFYWSIGRPGLGLLSLLFAYILVLWFAIQGYLFALLVELDQSIKLVIRNALFMAFDNIGLTLGLMTVNLLFATLAIIPWTAAIALPLAVTAITSNVNNRAVVDAIGRYRAAGRIIPSRAADNAPAGQEPPGESG
jgi:uncharacterized membrane protein YesL